jgi:hypothetical protein
MSWFEIIHQSIGRGGHLHSPDITRLQQLLRLNGYDGVDKHPRVNPRIAWDKATEDALVDFRGRRAVANPTWYDDPIPDNQPYVVPSDPILFELAYGANVLIPLSAGGKINRGAMAFEDVHEWCEKNCDGFAWQHAVWSLKDYPMFAIVTNESKNGTYYFDWQATQDADVRTPRALNCTLYANLMMSVWLQGNIHAAPYSPNVSKSGNDHHLAHERYKYPLVGLMESFEAVKAQVQNIRSDCIAWRLVKISGTWRYCIMAGFRVQHRQGA